MRSAIILGAALVAAPAWGQTCTIVTDGSLAVFQHEIAHCNGWIHAPFVPGLEPPLSLVHDYNGRLIVYITGPDYGQQMATMSFAQHDAKFIFQWDRTAASLCQQLWQANGVAAAAKDAANVIGCAVQ